MNYLSTIYENYIKKYFVTNIIASHECKHGVMGLKLLININTLLINK